MDTEDTASLDIKQEWEYSRLALPWLLLCAFLFAVLLVFTVWQQVGTTKAMYSGVPRTVRLVETQSEVSIPAIVVSAIGLCAGGLGVTGVWALAALHPTGTTRETAVVGVGFLLFLAAAMGWVAFGLQLADLNIQECPPLQRFTFESCQSRKGFAIAIVCIQALFSLMSGLCGFVTIYLHLMVSEVHGRDIEDSLMYPSLGDVLPQAPSVARPHAISHHPPSPLPLLSLATALLLLLWLILLVIILCFTATETVTSTRGRGDYTQNPTSSLPFETSGWPVINTWLRYAGLIVGFSTLAAAFLPSQSAAVAYLLGLLFLCTALLLACAFGWDMAALVQAQSYACPSTLDGKATVCSQAEFVPVCVIDVLAFLSLFSYCVFEYGYCRLHF